MSSSVSSKLVLVTGANKGIGYGIIENFLSRSGYHILLGSRDQKRGEDAVNALKSRKNNLSTVEFLSLDVNDDKSVNAAAEEVKRKFHGLDILINNAGIASKGSTVTYEIARTTIDTNYYGALRVLRAFTPLLKEGSRVVNVSSTMGQRSLHLMSETIRNRFLSEDLTLDGLNGLMEEFIAAVKDGSYIDKGWPNNTYGVSKSGMTMLGRLWSKEIKLNDVIVSSVCPNWVRTDMGGPNALRSVEEGAVTPVYCSLLPKGSPNGKFWRDEQLQPYV